MGVHRAAGLTCGVSASAQTPLTLACWVDAGSRGWVLEQQEVTQTVKPVGGSDSASSLPRVSQLSPVPGGAGSCLAVHQVPGRPTGCGLWSRGLFPPFLLLPLSFPLLLLLFQLSKHSGIRA